jgi:hypothetical protein
MVNYINKFLVYANKTDDNNHDDDDVSYTQKRRRDKNTCRKREEIRCFSMILTV